MTITRRTHLGLTLSSIGLGALGLGLSGLANAQDDSVYPAEAMLQTVFDRTRPPALVGASLNREGLVWAGVRGVRRVGSRDRAGVEDRWHLGSNTKAMTAALYGRLVEQGRAQWQVPMASLLPDMATDAAFGRATIENLLNHTAGLRDADVIGLDWLLSARADPASLVEQRRVIAQRALAGPPPGPPGLFAYANLNYIVAGAAIEAITGQSWEDAMTAEVFGPLGLDSGGFGPPGHDGDADAQPWGHATVGDTLVAQNPTDAGSDNPLALGPAGTAHMSIEDYARFVGVFLNEGAGWLKPETIAQLTRPAAEDQRSYGLGWITLDGQPWAKGPVIAHEGSNTMWHAICVADPVGGRAFIAMSNAGTRGAAACQALAQGLIRQVVGA